MEAYLSRGASFGIIVAYCVSFLSGCSLLHRQTVGDRIASGPSLVKAGEGLAAPISVSIREELRTGEALAVLAVVKAKTNWDPTRVSLQLRAFAEGSEVGRVAKPLSDLVGIFKAGQEISVPLSIAGQHFTDYQLELLWGEKAQGVVASSPEISSPNMGEAGSARAELIDLQFESAPNGCDRPPCPQGLVASGRIRNSGTKTLREVILGVGFVSVESGRAVDLLNTTPETEERVTLSGLEIAAGASRPVKLSIDTPLPPQQTAVRYVPNVRVIDSK
jgi:hypothetical protein